MATALAVAFAACWRFLWQRLNELRNVDAVGGFTGFSFFFYRVFMALDTPGSKEERRASRIDCSFYPDDIRYSAFYFYFV